MPRVKKKIKLIKEADKFEFESKYACCKWLKDNFRKDLKMKSLENKLNKRIKMGHKLYGYDIEVEEMEENEQRSD